MSSGFNIDVATMFVVTVFIVATGGLLLLFSWLQNRSTQALALWGIGYLLAAAGAALPAAAGFIQNTWTIIVANALICVAYGVMWGGARCFEGRPIRLYQMLGGAALWVAACQIEGFSASVHTRVALHSCIVATYALLSAHEIWHARDKELMSRWPALVIVILHAGCVLARIPLAAALPSPMGTSHLQSATSLVIAFEALFAAFCMAFLRVNMAKERAELEQRKAALADPLTGVANRRAFFDLGGPLLARCLAGRRPAALLLFDLDRFKQVNDTAGHQAGDRVLKAFSDLAAASMRPGDLFGRLGGEEFACLLLDASMAQALQVAERVRHELETMGVPGVPASATVSVGVATAGEAGRDLHGLLASADGALYRAKAKGRNRVEPVRAPLALVATASAGTGLVETALIETCGATAG
jgi:diguanylate cyclase (GGDEF)-like protein